jgi:pimeloyl-ACP methyl ester carboxylesterase
VYAVDLQAGLNVAEASMLNYEAAVTAAAGLLPRPLAVCAWSMGGLASMMAARRAEPDALVLLEPSPSREVQGCEETMPLEAGTFDGGEVYGGFPEGIRARLESKLARAERKRGISVQSVPASTLIVSGRDFAEDRGAAIAEFYGVEQLAFPEASHWDLVRDPVVRERIAARLV